jgi:2-C-methyl-D-erythritol 4-phosphate cytidylyltransferase/2-C-methyl-D-erythritol 2,4-cyclodiphosphate synthase
MSMSRYLALLPAAGAGTRFGPREPKQYARVCGASLLRHALRALCAEPRIERVCVVLAPGDTWFERESWAEFGDRVRALYCGGASRAESVCNGLQAMSDARTGDWILVHDAARPCLSATAIGRLMDEVGEDEAGGLLALPVADTLKRGNDAGRIAATVPRAGLWQAQTPQMFRYEILLRALKPPFDEAVTDEASAVERLGLQPRLVMGETGNLKVTHADDLGLAEAILTARSAPAGGEMRIGQGYDVHALAPGRKLVVGGVEIPFGQGLAGHSDADVLVHAVCDALLGAAALGDIGTHFPDTDARYRGIDSRKILRDVSELLAREGWRVASLDSTIIAQAPRMAPHIPRMRDNIASDLEVRLDDVSIKAKTAERLGAIGRGEGIAAQAIALIVRRQPES